MSDCQHTRVRSWFFDDTRDPAGFWSCADCGRKFEPVNFERDADAERYRWLRSLSRSEMYDKGVDFPWYEAKPENIDAAIDAAMNAAHER